jgi:dipeptidase D
VGDFKRYLCSGIEYLVSHLDGTYEIKGGYPEWRYKVESEFRDMVCQVYESMYDKKLVIEAVHAGLECGILSEKMPDVDMISFGPNLYEIHTPNEHLDIESTKRTFDFLVEILEKYGNAHKT